MASAWQGCNRKRSIENLDISMACKSHNELGSKRKKVEQSYYCELIVLIG